MTLDLTKLKKLADEAKESGDIREFSYALRKSFPLILKELEAGRALREVVGAVMSAPALQALKMSTGCFIPYMMEGACDAYDKSLEE